MFTVMPCLLNVVHIGKLIWKRLINEYIFYMISYNTNVKYSILDLLKFCLIKKKGVTIKKYAFIVFSEN